MEFKLKLPEEKPRPSLKRKLNERLGPCDVCKTETAKYTCPACEVHSCGLKCIAKHKADNDCDGIRVKTSYVPLKKYDQNSFIKDCQLLQEINVSIEKYARDKTKRYTRFEQNLPLHLHRLKKAVIHRGTRFFLLPEHFSRHRNNTTYLNWRTKQIDWKIQLTFLNAEMLTFHEDRCPETTVLKDLLSKYFTSIKSLKCYLKAGFGAIDVLIKAEKAPGGTRFYKLNLKENLKDNFYHKTIVEYPQLFVVIKDFYSAKTETEKKLDEAKKPKNNDFLQLNEDKQNVEEISNSFAGDAESSDDSDDEVAVPIPSYRDLIKPSV